MLHESPDLADLFSVELKKLEPHVSVLRMQFGKRA
jgi:hypothetical protein